MLCEKYKDAVIEAAVSGAELAPVVRAHIEACTSCAVEFDSAAIAGRCDRRQSPSPNERAGSGGDASAVRSAPRRSNRSQAHVRGSPKFSLAHIATLRVAATCSRLRLLDTICSTIDAKRNRADRHNLRQAELSGGTSSLRRTICACDCEYLEHGAPRHRDRISASRITRTHEPLEPEVLIPPDERIALEHFIAKSKARRELVAALAARRFTRASTNPLST